MIIENVSNVKNSRSLSTQHQRKWCRKEEHRVRSLLKGEYAMLYLNSTDDECRVRCFAANTKPPPFHHPLSERFHVFQTPSAPLSTFPAHYIPLSVPCSLASSLPLSFFSPPPLSKRSLYISLYTYLTTYLSKYPKLGLNWHSTARNANGNLQIRKDGQDLCCLV